MELNWTKIGTSKARAYNYEDDNLIEARRKLTNAEGDLEVIVNSIELAIGDIDHIYGVKEVSDGLYPHIRGLMQGVVALKQIVEDKLNGGQK